MHRIVATSPTVLALTLTPLFCQPVEMKEGGTTSCFETFNLMYIVVMLIEIISAGIFFGWLYGKIKNRKKAIPLS